MYEGSKRKELWKRTFKGRLFEENEIANDMRN
jgi:hypothetical protein